MKKHLLLLTSLLMLCGTAFAAGSTFEDQHGQTKSCKNAESTNEMKQCAYGDLEKSKNEMNNMYSNLIKSLRNSAKADASSLELAKRLERAQEAFLNFAEADASVDAFEMYEGSMEDLIRVSSLKKSFKARSKELRDLSKNN